MHSLRMGYGRFTRLSKSTGLFVLLIAFLISSIAGCADSQTTSNASVEVASHTRIVMFTPGVGQWAITTFGKAKPGNEFYFSGQLFRAVGSGKAQVSLLVDSAKLFEADRPSDATSRQPRAGDVVQILGQDTRPVSHALYDSVKPGATIRFQGVAYSVSSQGLAKNYSSAASRLQRIEITASAWQHVMDRHTPDGAKNAGTSIFYPQVNIRALIKDSELITPVPESNGYVTREFDAGYTIGYQGNRQTSTYRVVATQSGKLVTAYPIVQ